MIFGSNPGARNGVSNAALVGVAILLFSAAMAPYTAEELSGEATQSGGTPQIFQNSSTGQ